MPVDRFTVKGMKEFRSALRAVDTTMPKQVRLAMLEVSNLVTGRAQAVAPGRHGQAIRPRATQKAAYITIGPGRRGDSIAVFMGQSKRSGWYARPRYGASTGRQQRPWVGNQWVPGEQGGKPYYIGDAINRSVDDAVDVLGNAVERVAAIAFPD